MKTRSMFLAFILIFGYGSIVGQTFTGTLGVFSKYVLENGILSHDDRVCQADVLVSLPKGFFVDLWGSTGFERESNFGKEIDYTAGWSNKNLDLRLMYFDLNQVFDTKTADVVFPSIKVLTHLPLGAHQLTPYIQIACVIATRRTSEKSAALTRVGTTYEWTVSRRLSLSQNLWLLHDHGVFEGERGLLARWKCDLNIQILKSITLSPHLELSSPITVSDRKHHWVYAFNVIVK